MKFRHPQIGKNILGANDFEYFLWLIHFSDGTPGKSENLRIIGYYCVLFGP